MFKSIYNRIFPTIIALSALSVSASAAFYSVTGLSKLFAGASFQVIIMAGSLEVAKLVVASLLYQYWGKLNRLLKVYLTIATIVLVLITSAGIYGFLSAAYQETATKSEMVDKKVAVLNLKKDRFNENRTTYNLEKEKLGEDIAELRKALSTGTTVQYIDRESGQLITTTSRSTRQSFERQLDIALKSRDKISIKLEEVTDSITQLEFRVLDIENEENLSSELGPLKYLSKLTGESMDKIINWLLLVIIFVFDPLAIALVIAANFAFANLKGKTPEEEVAHQVERKAKQVKAPTPESNPTPPDIEEELTFETIVPEGKEFNTPYPLSEIMDIPKEKEIEEESKKVNEDIEETYSEKLKPKPNVQGKRVDREAYLKAAKLKSKTKKSDDDLSKTY